MFDPWWNLTMVCSDAGVDILFVSAAFPLLLTSFPVRGAPFPISPLNNFFLLPLLTF
jgi:hypothetical protein